MRSFKELQEELIILNKNGVNFLVAASICWLIIALIWYLPVGGAENKAYLTFFATAPMMPLAWVFSKLFDTQWKIKDNPLNTLGLWLNFAQLFYFPFVFIFLSKDPAEMPMALAIITGAHFFPYAWFYQAKGFAFMAGILAVSSALIGTSTLVDNPPLWIALLMAVSLWVLATWVLYDYRKVKGRSSLYGKNEASVTRNYAPLNL